MQKKDGAEGGQFSSRIVMAHLVCLFCTKIAFVTVLTFQARILTKQNDNRKYCFNHAQRSN